MQYKISNLPLLAHEGAPDRYSIDLPPFPGIEPSHDHSRYQMLIAVVNLLHQCRDGFHCRFTIQLEFVLCCVVTDVVGDGLRVGCATRTAEVHLVREFSNLVGSAV